MADKIQSEQIITGSDSQILIQSGRLTGRTCKQNEPSFIQFMFY
ncbi:hypothetical protein [Lacrimispora xylanisolvens]